MLLANQYSGTHSSPPPPMSDNPLLLLALIAAALYLAKGWWEEESVANKPLHDTRDDDCTTPTPAAGTSRQSPSAVPAPRRSTQRALPLAILGSLLLLGCETAGEYALGIVEEQRTITALFALYTLAGAFIEELIFRGYLVITGRGAAVRWVGIFAASLLFALLHPFLWEWEDEGFRLTLTLKAAFSTGIVFTASLWFYFLRFARCNPRHSLLPCIIAHMTKNLGVIAIKAAQGFLVGWY